MDRRRMTVQVGVMILPMCLGLIVGCDRDDSVQRYQVAKTVDMPVTNDPANVAPVAPAPAVEGAAPIHWTVPTGWTQLPGKDMRYASFVVSADHPDLQLTVVPLGGTGGSLLSNVNRWEGQIGLPPSSEEELKALIAPITVAGAPAVVFDRTGAEPADHSPPKRIIAAIVPHADRTWFLKLAGPNDLVQSQKPAFDAFVQSVGFDDAQGAAPAVGPTPPAAVTPTATDSTLPITFAVPAGWRQEPAQDNAFRVVAFKVAPGDDASEAIVTHVVKDSGTMLDNVNRWLGQVGLDAVDDAGKVPSQKLTVHGLEATVWDFENPAAKRGMIVTLVPHGTEWWFFKLTGNTSVVADQKSNFNSFVSSVAFRGDNP